MFAKLYAKYYEQLNQNKPYKKEISFVYKWAGEPESILDIGCGIANYWKYFPSDVMLRGVEKAKGMIEQSLHKQYIHHYDICEVDKNNLNFWYFAKYDCMTALFDVINYIPDHKWWKNLPLKKDGYFIFDIWDKKKIKSEGFRKTIRSINGITRVIDPLSFNKKEVKLNITISSKDFEESEIHKMYIYSEVDIKRFCGKEFKIVAKKETKAWQTWYLLKRK